MDAWARQMETSLASASAPGNPTAEQPARPAEAPGASVGTDPLRADPFTSPSQDDHTQLSKPVRSQLKPKRPPTKGPSVKRGTKDGTSARAPGISRNPKG